MSQPGTENFEGQTLADSVRRGRIYREATTPKTVTPDTEASVTPPDTEAFLIVSQAEFDAMRGQVAECYRIATELEAQLKPALARITSGSFSLSSLLFGPKR